MTAGDYNPWQSVTSFTGIKETPGPAATEFPAFKPTPVEGYTPVVTVNGGAVKLVNGEVPAQSALNGKDLTKDINVNINYKLTNPDATITHTVNYVDADNTKVGSQEFTNKPETKNVVENIQAPKGWIFVGADGKPAGNIGTVIINFGVKDSSQNIPVTHNIVKSYEYKDVTETINITAPEGGDFVDNQTKEHKSSEIIPVKLQVARLVTTDEFTGEVTPAGDWKANTVDDSTKQLLTEFPERSLPTFKGYTPQTDKGTITDGKLSSFPLIKNGQPVQDFTVKITYKSNNPDYGK